MLGEKKLTDAEKKKREEIAQAMERENPGMDMGKKMAIATAQAKKVAEEAELDEASAQARQNKDKKGELEAQRGLKNLKDTGRLNYDTNTRDAATREGRKMAKEEVDQIDEISADTLQKYRVKAKSQSNADYQKVRAYPFSSDKGKPGKGREMFDLMKKVNKRIKGVDKASIKLGKTRFDEQAEQEDLENFWEAYTTMFNEAEDQQQNMLLRAMAKDPSDLMKMKRAIKMGDKALTNPALRQEILAMLDKMMTLTTSDKSLLQRTRMGFQKAKKMKMPEEVQLEAIGAKDKQDEGEYGYEGDMAMSQLRTIIRNSEEMMKVLDKETDLPEWVQSKITLATDYLQTANDYLMSELEEEVEQVDEISTRTLARAAGAASDPDSDYAYGKSHDAQKFADHAKKTKDAKSAAAVQGAADAKGHYPRYDVSGRDKLADRTPSRVTASGKMYKQDASSLKRKMKEEVDKTAPFEGGREVKSTKSAAMRVKKIAKGMEKRYNKDKK
jgi:hypothetical protein